MKTFLLLISLLLCELAQATNAALRDPTRPLTVSRRQTSTLESAKASTRPAVPQLQLVLISTDRRYVVIDGELLTLGDSVRGLPLISISEDAVVLKTPSGPRTLPLSTPAEP
jgi:hypothetical protein